MAIFDNFSCLKGDYSFRILFFIIVFVQILVSSVITAQFYLIQHETSSEFTVIKSFPVTTVTSCVLECSASSEKCHKGKVETKENGQKVCYLLQNAPPPELLKLFEEKSKGTSGVATPNERSSLASQGFSVWLLSNSCKFERGGCPYIQGWVLQKRNLCYDATNYKLNIGHFKATQPGNVSQVALVHVQGFVQINENALKVHWGDVQPTDNCSKDRCFGTLILNANRRVIFPHNVDKNHNHNYNLRDFTDPKSSYITMSRELSPYMVERDEEFQVILGQQFMHGKNYYAGKHWIDVYFYFD